MKKTLIILVPLIIIFPVFSVLAAENPCYLRADASKGINQKLLANISFSLISQYLGGLEPFPVGGRLHFRHFQRKKPQRLWQFKTIRNRWYGTIHSESTV
jgi:hypothetical protein